MNLHRLPTQLCRWLIVCALAPVVHATSTDLATVPLITSAPQLVLPNLLFVLDDSGSMAWAHMPDDVGAFTTKYGFPSAQCNGVYYNPSLKYLAPATSTGASYPDASFTGAWVDGYNTSAGTVDLSKSFQAWTSATTNGTGSGGNDSSQAAYYYTYTGANTSPTSKTYLDTSSSFYSECNTKANTLSTIFHKVVVSAISGTGPAGLDERTNFANWYSYYRTRMLTMKTSAGLAFRSIGPQYRIGYMTLNNNQTQAFLDPATFDTSGKLNWYTKLYGAVPNNSTPLRVALATAGQYYAHKLTTINGVTVADPVQYSCQKNYTLLSTDGYWNDDATPTQIDGTTAIGNQDSTEPRPFNDGGTTANIYIATITVGGTGNTAVSGITVNGFQILRNATNSNTSTGTVASSIATNINKCTASIKAPCTVAGYSASVSGSTVTITAPTAVGALSTAPVVSQNNGGMTFTTTTFKGSPVAVNGTFDTLADVAEYYYKTDLRSAALGNDTGALGTGFDVAKNNVLPNGDDIARWQHMTTFTLGLGAPGRMTYSPTYKTDTTGDYASVFNGATATSTVCTWQSPGTVCTWPIPAANNPEAIDDLWHAAVNGRGTYFSATDPKSLSVGLNNALEQIIGLSSNAAAATTSNPNVTAGDNFIFSSTFQSVDWYGNFVRLPIDVISGQPATTPEWDAGALLNSNVSRTIYTRDATNLATGLKPFQWVNLTVAEQVYFGVPYISSLSQFCVGGTTCLPATSQALASGAPLLNFIRGDRANEGGAADTSKYFRQRKNVLGDIVDSEAVYVQAPRFAYRDAGYGTFQSTNGSRKPMVYVGANDGMLHAFNADTAANGGGTEIWAYVPQTLLPNLYKLADKNYASQHQYYVDGSLTQADVYFGGAWHTIIVGGFNGGGRGFFALDVTDPTTSPKLLWEVNNLNPLFANMGHSFGRPEIAKLKNGTWAVFLTSGYNNVVPGDGQGYLYVLNAGTGALINTIGTGQGNALTAVTGVCATAPCPSGLAQIRAWVDNANFDETTLGVYGGDLFGNVWRFDVNGDVGATGYDAQLLATLRGSSGNVQSVTARPELGKVGNYMVVYLGTGRYLGATDLSDTSGQTIYAIKDNLGSTSLGNPRAAGANFVQQTLSNGICPAGSAYCTANGAIRTGTNLAVNLATNNGWFVDLPSTGERSTTDPQLALGTLAVTTNVLNATPCSPGGSSFVNFFDYRTGAPVSTAGNMVSEPLGGDADHPALATRPVQLRFGDGTVRSLIRMSDNTWQEPLTPTGASPTGLRRTSWRELVTE